MDRCWFCGEVIEDEEKGVCFSMEWDAYYHEECYQDELAAGDEEAKIVESERRQ